MQLLSEMFGFVNSIGKICDVFRNLKNSISPGFSKNVFWLVVTWPKHSLWLHITQIVHPIPK
jgi:hypothetical protein